MAEPMSSNEIEDVLSSIRRLVAQDLKPADRAKLAAVADATQKLVLAPEQRIEDGPAKFATVRRPSRRAAFPPVDSVLAGVASLVGRGAPATEAATDHEDWALGAAVRDDAPAPTMPDYVAAAEAYEDQGENAQTDWPPAGTTFAAPADLDVMITLPPGYGEEDAPHDSRDFAVDPHARLFDVAPNGFSGDSFAADPAPNWSDIEPEDAGAAQHDYAASAPQDGGLQGTIEPDSDWADAAEARVIAELAGEVVAEEVYEKAKETFREPKFAAAAPQSAPEVLFDEDVLRAMVQAIFREEMAGPMGERITRNIRKLVRAEVGRMLAAHELE